MRRVAFKLCRESYESQSKAGRYNPARVVKVDSERFLIGAGTNDDVDVFKEGGPYLVLVVNRGLGYCGLEVFSPGDCEPSGEVFLQADYEIEDVLGKRGLGLADATIARRLYWFIGETR
jgi:hypothetical protein